MNIVLYGKSGQLGQALLPAMAPLGHITAPDSISRASGAVRNRAIEPNERMGLPAPSPVDFRNPAQLFETTLSLAPDVIVNAAAYTAVDQAERDPACAMRINADSPAALAHAAAQCGALLIHYSSDYVFDGMGSKPWLETDIAQPLNVYGQSKLAGDLAIMRSGCRHLIFRTSWLYACQGSGFLQQMMRLAQTCDTLRVVNDQIGAPTSARLLAQITAAVMDIYTRSPATVPDGLYHVAAAGQTSWFDYACHIFARMRANGCHLALERVVPVSTQQYGSPARRPLNSRLDTGKLTGTFGLSLPDWQEGVDATVDALCQHVTNDSA